MKDKKKNNLDRFIEEVQREITEEEKVTYSEKVLQEANNPKNVGRIAQADGFGIIDGSCGDTVEIYLKIKRDRIEDIKFMTDGCGATIACGSMLTSMVKDKTVDEANAITKDDLLTALDGLPDENLHCAALLIGALRKAILNYRKNEKQWCERNEMRVMYGKKVS